MNRRSCWRLFACWFHQWPCVSTPRGFLRCKPPKILVHVNFWFVWVHFQNYLTHTLEFWFVRILGNLGFVHFKIQFVQDDEKMMNWYWCAQIHFDNAKIRLYGQNTLCKSPVLHGSSRFWNWNTVQGYWNRAKCLITARPHIQHHQI